MFDANGWASLGGTDANIKTDKIQYIPSLKKRIASLNHLSAVEKSQVEEARKAY